MIAVVVAALTATVATAAAGRPVQASGPIQVTGASPYPAACSQGLEQFYGSETEIALAVSPLDSRQLATTYMQDANIAHPVSVSRDAGKTWTQVRPGGQTQCDGGSAYAVFDPWISYGADGRLYLSGATGAEPGTGDTVAQAVGEQDFFARHVVVQTSTDDGRTWSAPVNAGGDVDNGYLIDKPTLTADSTRAATAYATWTRINFATGTSLLGFSRTRDGGRSWAESTLPGTFLGERGVVFGSQVVVLPSGDLLMFVAEGMPQPQVLAGPLVNATLGAEVLPRFLGDSRFYVLRSADQGASWSAPVSLGAAKNFPQIAYGAVGRDGYVYATWATGDPDGTSDLVFSSSADGGRTWSVSRAVVPGVRRGSVPVVAVDGEGNVALSWYEDRAWIAVSTDRGQTWSSLPMTQALDLSAAPSTNSAGGLQLGDYEGLVGVDRGFVATFAVPAPYAAAGTTDVYAVRIGVPNVR